MCSLFKELCEMSEKSNMIAAVAGCVGLGFLGYCFYFDRKRRSDPDFKRKLIESESNILTIHWEN